MPIYEYQCEKCGKQVEVLQKVNDPLMTECSSCHKPTLKRLISAAGFQLKGTGWYATDFRDKGKSKPTENKNNQNEKENEKKTNSIPEAKKETPVEKSKTD